MISRVQHKIKNSLSPYKSDVLRTIHLGATDMHALKLIDDEKMKGFDKSCLKRKRIMSSRTKKIALALAVVGLVGKTVEIIRIYRAPTRG